LTRSLRPELLDGLDAADPRAIRSRRDLRKINVMMGTHRVIARALRGRIDGARIVELGTGDGTLLLRAARRIGVARNRVHAVLVDRRPSVGAHTLASFNRLGWDVEPVSSDVFAWLARPGPVVAHVVVANLFLHHFDESRLRELLAAVSQQTMRFVACEPHRSRAALIGASLLGMIGCNDVTRHDGRISVHAGFRDRELSAAWPHHARWQLDERRIGPFTQTLIADHVA
jgi:hypothetical protein